jgi:biopolymer transport protein ExbB/TolQ
VSSASKHPTDGRSGNQPLFWGIIASIAFYICVHQPQMRGTLLHIYTTEHVTEYVIVILFFWAAADLVLSYLRLPRERTALNHVWLPARTALEPVEQAGTLSAALDTSPPPLQTTKMGRRLRRALSFVHERRSADGFREYLQDLAARDAEETHSHYGFPRFVAAVTPILGLLGTVVHFGAALRGLSTDQLIERLPGMVSGMGTAFNTTCVALTASISTMLFLFLIQRQEEQVVQQVNASTEKQLLNRFATTDTRLTPFLDAVRTAHHSTLLAMQQFEQKQMEHWSRQMDQQHERWESSDRLRESQLRQLLSSLDQQQSLHSAQLRSAVDELSAVNDVTLRVAELLTADGKLLDLQARLSDNLVLLRQTQQIDQAMHGLTAAIHLLTARQSPSAATARAA